MKRILLCPSSLILAWSLSATTASAANFSGLWVVNQTVPDFSIIGLNDTRNVTSDISNILGITVTLNLTGGWSGDLYAYVTNGSGFSVLLNSPGRTSANPIGAPGWPEFAACTASIVRARMAEAIRVSLAVRL